MRSGRRFLLTLNINLLPGLCIGTYAVALTVDRSSQLWCYQAVRFGDGIGVAKGLCEDTSVDEVATNSKQRRKLGVLVAQTAWGLRSRPVNHSCWTETIPNQKIKSRMDSKVPINELRWKGDAVVASSRILR